MTTPAGRHNRTRGPRSAASADGARVAPRFRDHGRPVCVVMAHRKIGRPSKGDRELVRAKMPVRLRDAAYQEAARRGMTFTDLLGELLAEATGVPYTTQEALDKTA